MRLPAPLLVLLLAAAALRAGAADAPIPEASEDYVLHCSACHAFDGAGVPGVVPTLHGIALLLDAPGGRAYLAQVPGVAQAPLSDARLARLLDWVLLSFSGATPEPPYSAAEVGALRATPLRDPAPVREALLATRPPRPDAGGASEAQ
jgi:mono/diheme cytochrome c family protein